MGRPPFWRKVGKAVDDNLPLGPPLMIINSLNRTRHEVDISNQGSSAPVNSAVRRLRKALDKLPTTYRRIDETG
jgi:hypothetical protein